MLKSGHVVKLGISLIGFIKGLWENDYTSLLIPSVSWCCLLNEAFFFLGWRLSFGLLRGPFLICKELCVFCSFLLACGLKFCCSCHMTETSIFIGLILLGGPAPNVPLTGTSLRPGGLWTTGRDPKVPKRQSTNQWVIRKVHVWLDVNRLWRTRAHAV